MKRGTIMDKLEYEARLNKTYNGTVNITFLRRKEPTNLYTQFVALLLLQVDAGLHHSLAAEIKEIYKEKNGAGSYQGLS